MRRFPALIALLLGAGLFALLAPPVRALTFYAVGSEDTSFTQVGTSPSIAGETLIVPGRTAFENATVGVGNSIANPPAQRWIVGPFTSTSSLWFHAWFESTSAAVPSANSETWIARSPDGTARLMLRQTGTYGQFKLSTYDGTTFTDIGTASANYTSGSGNQIDINVNYTCSGAGSVTVYLNGVAVISFSGNPCTGSATQLNQIEFSGLNGTGSANQNIWSEVIVADSDTRGMALVALPPQAAGATQGWTPNTLANIQKQVINDTTFISTGSSSVKSEWTLPTTLPSGSFSVLGVAQEARTEVGTSGPAHYNWLLHISGSDFTSGSVAPTTSFGNNQTIWTTNPSTGTGWQPSDLTAGIQAGIESAP